VWSANWRLRTVSVRWGWLAVRVAGGADKARLAADTFGYAHAIDYRAASDLSAAFALLNPAARVIQCGSAGISSLAASPQGPRRERDMIVKRLSWHGFDFTDHKDLFPAARRDLQRLYQSGGWCRKTACLTVWRPRPAPSNTSIPDATPENCASGSDLVVG